MSVLEKKLLDALNLIKPNIQVAFMPNMAYASGCGCTGTCGRGCSGGCSDSCSGYCSGDCSGNCDGGCDNSCEQNCDGAWS